MSGTVRLFPEPGCCFLWRWRIEGDEGFPKQVGSVLPELGWVERASAIPGLRRYWRDGCEWLLVVSSGRMELRLDLCLPLDVRRAVAVQLVRELARACHRGFVCEEAPEGSFPVPQKRRVALLEQGDEDSKEALGKNGSL